MMEKKNLFDTLTFMILSFLCVLVGVIFIMDDTISTKSFCYLLSSLSVVSGIVEITKFFLTKAYKRLNDYSFALGIFLVAIGCTGLLRVNDLAHNFTMILGLPILIVAVLIAQFAVQLNAHDNSLWGIELIISAALTIGSVMVLSGILIGTAAYILLIVSGSMNALSYGMVFFSIRKKQKETPPPVLEGHFEEIDHAPEEKPKDPEKDQKFIMHDDE